MKIKVTSGSFIFFKSLPTHIGPQEERGKSALQKVLRINIRATLKEIIGNVDHETEIYLLSIDHEEPDCAAERPPPAASLKWFIRTHWHPIVNFATGVESDPLSFEELNSETFDVLYPFTPKL